MEPRDVISGLRVVGTSKCAIAGDVIVKRCSLHACSRDYDGDDYVFLVGSRTILGLFVTDYYD